MSYRHKTASSLALLAVTMEGRVYLFADYWQVIARSSKNDEAICFNTFLLMRYHSPDCFVVCPELIQGHALLTTPNTLSEVEGVSVSKGRGKNNEAVCPIPIAHMKIDLDVPQANR